MHVYAEYPAASNEEVSTAVTLYIVFGMYGIRISTELLRTVCFTQSSR
jgi:hypothetical protein